MRSSCTPTGVCRTFVGWEDDLSVSDSAVAGMSCSLIRVVWNAGIATSPCQSQSEEMEDEEWRRNRRPTSEIRRIHENRLEHRCSSCGWTPASNFTKHYRNSAGGWYFSPICDPCKDRAVKARRRKNERLRLLRNLERIVKDHLILAEQVSGKPVKRVLIVGGKREL